MDHVVHVVLVAFAIAATLSLISVACYFTLFVAAAVTTGLRGGRPPSPEAELAGLLEAELDRVLEEVLGAGAAGVRGRS